MFPILTGFINYGQQTVRVARYIGQTFMITLSRVLLNSRIWVIQVDSRFDLQNPMFDQTKIVSGIRDWVNFGSDGQMLPRALL